MIDDTTFYLFAGLAVIEGIVIYRLRRLLGPTFDSAMKVLTFRIKNPGLFITFRNNKYASIEFRETNKTQHIDDDVLSSPVVTLNKQTIYRTYLNYPTYTIYQGQVVTVNPLEYVVSFEEFERLGLLFNKALEAEEQRVALRYKTLIVDRIDKIYKLMIVTLLVVLIIAYFFYNMQSFFENLKKTYEVFKPVIEDAAAKLPHISPSGGQDLAQQLVQGISGQKP